VQVNSLYEALRCCAMVRHSNLPEITMDTAAEPKPPSRCNMDRAAFLSAVEETKEHIRAGDVFQLVLSQRFERTTRAAPFDIYRALRIVNPSPYMVYLQVCASYEICLVLRYSDA
jgi:anthranilate synthase component I